MAGLAWGPVDVEAGMFDFEVALRPEVILHCSWQVVCCFFCFVWFSSFLTGAAKSKVFAPIPRVLWDMAGMAAKMCKAFFGTGNSNANVRATISGWRSGVCK